MNIPEAKYKGNSNDPVKTYTIDTGGALQDKINPFHATVFFSIPPDKIRKPLIF